MYIDNLNCLKFLRLTFSSFLKIFKASNLPSKRSLVKIPINYLVSLSNSIFITVRTCFLKYIIKSRNKIFKKYFKFNLNKSFFYVFYSLRTFFKIMKRFFKFIIYIYIEINNIRFWQFKYWI